VKIPVEALVEGDRVPVHNPYLAGTIYHIRLDPTTPNTQVPFTLYKSASLATEPDNYGPSVDPRGGFNPPGPMLDFQHFLSSLQANCPSSSNPIPGILGAMNSTVAGTTNVSQFSSPPPSQSQTTPSVSTPANPSPQFSFGPTSHQSSAQGSPQSPSPAQQSSTKTNTPFVEDLHPE
jgi:hypothetical protein